MAEPLCAVLISQLESQIEAVQKEAECSNDKAEAAWKIANAAKKTADSAKKTADLAKKKAEAAIEAMDLLERVIEQKAMLGQFAQLICDKFDELFDWTHSERVFPSFSKVAQYATERLESGRLPADVLEAYPQLEELLARFPRQAEAPGSFTATAKVIKLCNTAMHQLGGESLTDLLDQCKSAEALSESFDDLIAHSVKKTLALKKKPEDALTRNDILLMYQLSCLLGVEGVH